MKILHVINAYYPPYSSGGAAFVAHNISKTLAKRGHEVTVYTTNVLSRNELFYPERNPNHSEGVEIYYFRNAFYKPSIHIYFSKEFIEAIKKSINNYDIVHLHEYRSYIAVSTLNYTTKQGVPSILQIHGDLPRLGALKGLKCIFDVLFGYKLLRDASKIIALNRIEAEQCRSMGVPEEKIVIIPNGIDLSEYANLPPKGLFKKKFNIPEDKKIVLYLGRIHKIKGIDFLIKAYAYLTKKMNFKGTILVIAGPDDGYLSEVKLLVQSLGVSSSVLFTGPLYGRDKLEAYVDSDVYVLPSRYETFPMSLLEAYACGKPVIASNVGGLEELVINGETGLLFEAGNVEQLADRLLFLLNHDDESKEMGKKAKEFVQERYSIEKVVEKLEKVYEEVAIK